MEKIYHSLLDEAIDKGLNVALIGEAGAGKEYAAQLLHSRRKATEFIKYDCQNGVTERWGLVARFLSDLNLWFSSEPEVKETRFLRDIHGLDRKQIGYILDHLHMHLEKSTTSSELLNAGLVCSCEPHASDISPWKELIIQFFPIDISIPPLRERKREIPLLVSELLREYQRSNKKSITGIDNYALTLLENYSWPGNISELKSVLYQACTLTQEHGVITPAAIANRILVHTAVN